MLLFLVRLWDIALFVVNYFSFYEDRVPLILLIRDRLNIRMHFSWFHLKI